MIFIILNVIIKLNSFKTNMKLSNRSLFWITTVTGLFPLLGTYFNSVGLIDSPTQTLINGIAVAVLGYFQFTNTK